MKIRNLATLTLCLGMVVTSCKKDDNNGDFFAPIRDKQEVYDENIIEIEEYLATHFYNYDEFQQNPIYSDLSTNPYTVTPNDTFKIVFDTIAGANSNKIPLIDQVAHSIVKDPEGIEHKLYYLTVREGTGGDIHPIDQVFASYKGYLINGEVFDSAVSGIPFHLTSVGTVRGVVIGFSEGITKFKARESFTEVGDGTIINHNHGIGAVFVPSGLGYFAQNQLAIPAYSNLIFAFNSEKRTLLDHDNDGVFSYLEDLNGNKNYYDDDTNGNGVANFLDPDDDGDGIPTKDEIQWNVYTQDANMQPFNTYQEAEAFYNNTVTDPEEELLYSIIDNNNGTFTLKTVIYIDSNGNGIPDYLDPTYPG